MTGGKYVKYDVGLLLQKKKAKNNQNNKNQKYTQV